MSTVCFILWKQVKPYWIKCIGTVENPFLILFCCSRIEQFVEMCTVWQENLLKCWFLYLFKTTTASLMKRFQTNELSLVSDFHRSAPKMVKVFLVRYLPNYK